VPYCEEQGITEIAELDNRALDRLSARLLHDGGSRGQLSRHSVHSYMRSINHFLLGARQDHRL
jgi:hypothetical protein